MLHCIQEAVVCARLCIDWLIVLWRAVILCSLGEASWTVDSLVELAILHQPCMRAAAPKARLPLSVWGWPSP